jgi:hypothetical protein
MTMMTRINSVIDRAEEIRVLAERMVDAETNRTLEKIASDHELLARRADERLRGSTLDD